MDKIQKSHEMAESEKIAIDEALEDIANGRIQTHKDVMEKTKKRFPHLFNR